MVSFQLRARGGGGIDHPELLHGAHVPADEGEALAVRGPGQVGDVAGGAVGLGVSAIVVAVPGEVLGAVGGEGALHQGAVLVVLGGLAQVLPVHDPQVVVLDIDAHAAVRGDVGPGGILVLVLLGVVGELGRCDVIVETVLHELTGGVAGAVALLRLGLHIPLEVLVVL